LDTKKILEYIKHPENITFEDAALLEELSEKYPFCQTLFVLRLIHSFVFLPNVYMHLLPEVSLRTSNRSNLKNMLAFYSEKKNNLTLPTKP
jgi:hypothetical protein